MARCRFGELVDLHGRLGYDVLCITDHALRDDRSRWTSPPRRAHRRFDGYLKEVTREGERAWSRYGLLVIAGLELTYEADDGEDSAHAVAVGLPGARRRRAPIDRVLRRADAAGAALIAAHPDAAEDDASGRATRRLGAAAVAAPSCTASSSSTARPCSAGSRGEGLPAVASGDVHVAAHVDGWKTLIPCAKSPDVVVAYLRSSRPVYLARLEARPSLPPDLSSDSVTTSIPGVHPRGRRMVRA